MITYEIFEQQKLMLIRYAGKIFEEDLMEFIPLAFKIAEKNEIKLVLDDFRNAIFKFDLKALSKIIEVAVNCAKRYNDFKEVHLIDSIIETTYTLIYNEKIKENYSLKVCSTIEFAIDYLGLSIHQQVLESSIQNLKFKFENK